MLVAMLESYNRFLLEGRVVPGFHKLIDLVGIDKACTDVHVKSDLKQAVGDLAARPAMAAVAGARNA